MQGLEIGRNEGGFYWKPRSTKDRVHKKMKIKKQECVYM